MPTRKTRYLLQAIKTTLVVICAGGCSTGKPSTARFSMVQIDQGNRAKVLTAAEAALIDSGFSIDMRDDEEGVLTTLPRRDAGRTSGSEKRPHLSSRPDRRQVARVRVSEATGTVAVYCRVVVQEQSTEAVRFFSDNQGSNDVPNETAIDRDAGTTARQNTVWKTIRRVRPDERRILAAIARRADDG